MYDLYFLISVNLGIFVEMIGKGVYFIFYVIGNIVCKFEIVSSYVVIRKGEFV